VNPSALITEMTFPKTAWKVSKYYYMILCQENVSECLPYASSVPIIVKISAFLISKDWLQVLKYVCSHVLIFKCLLLTLNQNFKPF
jgi:hypothetical protein